ncbi:hypothetical protein QFX18_08975 [Saccharophagus degradans]|uniref:hypothetical protein n=1 Tax=Saccharophagus degradans TaxID=86304 RepID=UPI00247825E3|nr:hypothetical protein [Saccharophagus degradans]WGP00181.1 hypothetical protein QFX18_08975 [Saccharophagus degradans]
MKLGRFQCLAILSGICWAGASQTAFAGPISAEAMAEKKQERLARFHERVVETSAYDAWLSRPEDGIQSNNACVTNYASIKVEQAKPATGPSISDEDIHALARELTSERVKYLQKGTSPMLPMMIDQALKREGVSNISELSDNEVFMLFTVYQVEMSDEDRLSYNQYYQRWVQKSSLQATGGVKNNDWFKAEGTYRKLPLQMQRTQIAIDKTLGQEEKNTRLRAIDNKIKQVENEVYAEKAEYEKAQRYASGNGKESFPFATVYVFHKLERFTDSIPLVGTSAVDTDYQKQLVASVVGPVAQRCPDLRYIVIKHRFNDLISNMDWRIGQTIFVNQSGSWLPEKVPSKQFNSVYLEDNEFRSPAYYTVTETSATDIKAYWSRGNYMEKYSAYEASLMQDNGKIALPDNLQPPKEDDILMMLLREVALNSNADIQYGASRYASPYFGGHIVSRIDEISNVVCQGGGRQFNCSFDLEGVIYFSGQGGAQLVREVIKLKTGSAEERVSEHVQRTLVMTEAGWRSPDEEAQIKSYQREMMKSVAKGFENGACAVENLGPDYLVSAGCQ